MLLNGTLSSVAGGMEQDETCAPLHLPLDDQKAGGSWKGWLVGWLYYIWDAFKQELALCSASLAITVLG